jgi:spore coat protein U-like protein
MTLRSLLRPLLAAAAFAALLAAAPASAQSTTFQVTANVARVCTIAATPVAFGAYDPVSANGTAAAAATATGTVTVACTRGQTYRVSLDDGANYSAGRRMQLGASGEYLSYELYQDAAFGTVWNTTNQVAGSATSRDSVALTVYGRLPGGQDVPVGAYLDTVTADVHL